MLESSSNLDKSASARECQHLTSNAKVLQAAPDLLAKETKAISWNLESPQSKFTRHQVERATSISLGVMKSLSNPELRLILPAKIANNPLLAQSDKLSKINSKLAAATKLIKESAMVRVKTQLLKPET